MHKRHYQYVCIFTFSVKVILKNDILYLICKSLMIKDLHKVVGRFALGEPTKAKTRILFGIRDVSGDVRDVFQVEGQHLRLARLLRSELADDRQFRLRGFASVDREANLTLRVRR